MSWIYAQETTRFMVVGDPHNYSPAANFKETVLYEIVQAAIDEDVDFIFFTGDLVIRSFGEFTPIDSVLKDWRCVLNTLSNHNINVFACRGNNDLSSKESWDSLFSDPYSFPQNGPENEKNITYALEFNNILFIAMDQYIETHRINQNWLNGILTNNEKPHVFVAGHEPAFKLLHTNCMGAYPEERNIFWESLINAGTKIFFCAHDHFYDHAVIDDGDGNAMNDIHQVIVGTASSLHQDASYDGDNGRWAPDRIFHEEKNGYVLVEIEGDDVQFTWKHRTESNVFEYGGDSYTFPTNLLGHKNILLNYDLFQNHPNPFNPSTVISWQLAVGSKVDLSIYNILGQKITTLVSEKKTAGYHEVEFNGQNLSSGVYLYRIVVDSFGEAGEFQDVRKMVFDEWAASPVNLVLSGV
jgi:predicted phosphodiesterase